MILSGWKDIAKYFGRGVRTVQRWERFGLPTHRPKGSNRAAVCAYTEELDTWLKDSHMDERTNRSDFAKRVLVVDDDEALLAITTALLKNEGYEVMTARDGFEALACLRGATPDILISDLKMPNMSGFELLAVVRKRFPGMTALARTGEFMPLGQPEGLLADGFLQKGETGASELVEMIGKLLAQSPFRSQPAKPDAAPAWLPRSTTDYVVLTCPMCLRSFSIPRQVVETGVVLKESCVHCGVDVRYRFDPTVIAKKTPSALRSGSEPKTQKIEAKETAAQPKEKNRRA